MEPNSPTNPAALPPGFGVATRVLPGEGWLAIARRALLGGATMGHAIQLMSHNPGVALTPGATVFLPPSWYAATIN